MTLAIEVEDACFQTYGRSSENDLKYGLKLTSIVLGLNETPILCSKLVSGDISIQAFVRSSSDVRVISKN